MAAIADPDGTVQTLSIPLQTQSHKLLPGTFSGQACIHLFQSLKPLPPGLP